MVELRSILLRLASLTFRILELRVLPMDARQAPLNSNLTPVLSILMLLQSHAQSFGLLILSLFIPHRLPGQSESDSLKAFCSGAD
jgi:hypothetical protein